MPWLDREGSSSWDREALAAWHEDRVGRAPTIYELPEDQVIRCDRCEDRIGVKFPDGAQDWVTEVAEVVKRGSPEGPADDPFRYHETIHVGCMTPEDDLA